MGQYPALLALPGFSADAQPRECLQNVFLSSVRFAEQNRLQMSKLLSAPGVSIVDGVVESPLEFVSDRWMVPLTRERATVTVRTKGVDICTGPGPGRVFSPGSERVFGPWAAGIRDSFDGTLLQELRDGVGNRALIAENFMAVPTIDNTVLVVGEGPLAASAAEHALRCGAKSVYWVGRPIEMSNSFPPSLRYDGLVQHAEQVRELGSALISLEEKGIRADVTKLKGLMVPVDPRLTIILGLVSRVQFPSATLTASAPYPMLTLSSEEQVVHLTGTALSQLFDTIVLSASSQTRDSERHSAAHLLKSIPKSVSSSGLVPISCDAMFVGLQVPDGSLRVLGAASRNPFLVNRLRSNSREEQEYRSWHDSLCAQARMADGAMGITVGAATIAMANQYYSAKAPDTCGQTVRLDTFPLRVERESRATPFEQSELATIGYHDFPRSS